jgi:hypothetical protein
MIGNSFMSPYGIPVPVQVPMAPEDTPLAHESTEKLFQHIKPLWSNIKNNFKLFQNQNTMPYQEPNHYPNYFQQQLFTPHTYPEESINFLNYQNPNHGFGLKFGHDGWFLGGGHSGPSFHHHQHQGPFKKLKSKAKKLKGAALSALTLLAFLFFLHVMQTCLKEHMDNNNANPTVSILVNFWGLETINTVSKNHLKIHELEFHHKFYQIQSHD